jgi:hypothetical protein
VHWIGEKKPWCCNIEIVIHGLVHWIDEKKPWWCIDRVVHGLLSGIHEKRPLFSPVSCTRPVSTICVYYTMVFSHPFHTWDHGPLYLSIHHHGLFCDSWSRALNWWKETMVMYRQSGPWSPVWNSWKETMVLQRHTVYINIEIMDHFICLYITMVSSHQFYTWDHGPLYLSIQHGRLRFDQLGLR